MCKRICFRDRTTSSVNCQGWMLALLLLLCSPVISQCCFKSLVALWPFEEEKCPLTTECDLACPMFIFVEQLKEELTSEFVVGLLQRLVRIFLECLKSMW